MELKKTGVLKGVRVTDFCHAALGPITTHFMADFGAEVIKIETEDNLDATRRTDPFKDNEKSVDNSIPFARYNQNKYSVLINLKEKEGLALVKRLIKISDVVTNNFTVGVMDKLGLSYEEVRKVKEDIIYVNITFAGDYGPYSKYRGFGGLSAAMAGLNDLTGYPDGYPCAPVSAYTDHYCPPIWLTSIVAALTYKKMTGKGQYICCSAHEGGVESLDSILLDYMVNGHQQTRRGNRHPYAVPHGVYPTKGQDKWIAVAIFNDEEWRAFCQVLGKAEIARDEKFATLLARQEHVEELEQLISGWTAQWDSDELMYALQNAGVSAGTVSDAERFYNDPQFLATGHFWEPADPWYKEFTYEAPAFRLSKGEAKLYRPHPRFWEHHDYVFKELLNLSDEEYARYIEEKVIA
jgi:crotonobetainyl-CoA:carnitine CoA-transferase CaiB-like acyl-CoA transferase